MIDSMDLEFLAVDKAEHAKQNKAVRVEMAEADGEFTCHSLTLALPEGH